VPCARMRRVPDCELSHSRHSLAKTSSALSAMLKLVVT
jgi:hypothetical protein